MAGGRGRRRRQAAKSYDESHQNETRWVNAIQIPLPPQGGTGGGNHCCGSSSSLLHRTESVLPVLELSGFQSQTRTIFARIVERNDGMESVNDGNNKTIRRDCWRVEDLVGTIVNEIVLREAAAAAVINVNGENSNDNNFNDTKKSPASVEIESSQSLLELGSVWVLDPASSDRPQNKPVWKRLLKEDKVDDDEQKEETDANSLFWFDETMTLRVHSRPSRYPMARNFRMALEQQQQQKAITSNDKCSDKSKSSNSNSNIHGGIVYEKAIGADRSIEETVAFAVLNKPVGMPSHSTVDNAVENLLYQYHTHRNLEYASLPQRLDTETSGLVLVTTLPTFATYFSKLLEQKSTAKNTNPSLLPSLSPSVTTRPSIQKQYRCLVTFPNGSSEDIRDSIQKNYVQTRKIVEHFVDANSNAPKTFVSAREFHKIDGAITKEKSSVHSAGSTHKWQLCKLRILSMTDPIPIQPRESFSEEVPSPKDTLCSEVEIELLTGRTHQIRGQLLALGCPIFGDPLYGKANANTNVNTNASPTPKNWRDRSALRMALQCCQLSFPLDASSVRIKCKAPSPPLIRGSNSSKNNPYHRRNRRVDSSEDRKPDAPGVEAFVNSPEQFEFRLDSAWWRDFASCR